MLAFPRYKVGSPKTLRSKTVVHSLEGQNMNYFKLPLVVLLSLCVSGLLAIVPAAAQGTTALERGGLALRRCRRDCQQAADADAQ